MLSYNDSRCNDIRPDLSNERKDSKSLSHVSSFFTHFCRFDPYKGHSATSRYPLSPEIALSVVVLADSITKAAFTITWRKFDIDWGRKRASGRASGRPNEKCRLVSDRYYYSIERIAG